MFALFSECVAGCRNPDRGSATISPSQWPLRELEVHEAYSQPFPGSTPEHDEYASFFVDSQPFLGTGQIDRLECMKGSVFVILRDRAATDFESRTSQLFANAGRLAIYVDGKLNAAPLVRGRIVGGRFQLLHVVCKSSVSR